MKLNLKRPIIFFDLETTGVDTAKDRIVEISMAKIMPDGEEIVKTRKLNPEMHIPEEATAIHGITDEDVKDCPTFAQVAKSLEQFIRGCDFGGFNSNRFDLPVLVEEFLRAEKPELDKETAVAESVWRNAASHSNSSRPMPQCCAPCPVNRKARRGGSTRAASASRWR